jgi:uncharacterized membrane-anchored protein
MAKAVRFSVMVTLDGLEGLALPTRPYGADRDNGQKRPRDVPAGRDGSVPLEHHAQRAYLHEELHSRPQPEIAAPAAISFMLLLAGEAEVDRVLDAVAGLCRRYGAAPPHGERYFAAQLGELEVRWEQHTEFFTLTFIRTLPDPKAPFAGTAIELVPKDWLDALPGQVLTAAHIALVPEAGPWRPADIAVLFEGQRVSASRASGGAAAIWTAFRPHGDGFVRYLVAGRQLSRARAGRLVQRLIEIEAYRMMALLGLPVARANSLELRRMEERLAEQVARIGAVRDLAGEKALLDELFALAAAAERMVAETEYRFGATGAYGQLVADRFRELRAERLEDYQPLAEFLERRFEPALRTCRSIQARQVALEERIARTANLARTRVFVELERQNQELLASMDRRAKLQLRLQETVEGLSVAAISYYLVGLAAYALKPPLKELGLGPGASDLVIAGLTPFVVLAVWWGMRQTRRRLHGRES